MTRAARPVIPLVSVGSRGPLALLESHRDKAEAVLAAGQAQLGRWPLALLDRRSQSWARRGQGPYLHEIEAAVEQALPPGLWFMNHCYEWGCTSSAGLDPQGPGARLLRTLDWPFDGLGRCLVVAHQESAAGDFYNVTWPGYLGTITAMAPGRFSVAINQTPVRRCGPSWLPRPWFVDWALQRRRTLASRAIAPDHLLRQVCETCPDYETAKAKLMETPLALPVFYVLAGIRPEESCVIERLEEAAYLHEAPAAVANHWLSDHLQGRPRGRVSQQRRATMTRHCGRVARGFDWLDGGILNPDTRLALVANATSGDLLLRGYEKDGLVTQTFDLLRAKRPA